jgi:hypothetical protein
MDLDYRHDATHGWVVTGWDVTMMARQGKVSESSKTTVTSLEVNGTLPSRDFENAFPAGAVVHDNLSHEAWIVRSDGSKRMIARHERRLTYEQLVESDRGGGLVGTQARRLTWPAIGLAICGFGCLIAFIWRRLRKRVRQATT